MGCLQEAQRQTPEFVKKHASCFYDLLQEHQPTEIQHKSQMEFSKSRNWKKSVSLYNLLNPT